MTSTTGFSNLMRWVGYLVAVGLIALTGLAHAYWTAKWSPAQGTSVSKAVERLKKLPSEFGSWRGASLEIPAFQLEEGEIDGYRAWEFRDLEKGRQLTAFIVCGRPGPISLHTPDWCYGGAGYEVRGSIERCELLISNEEPQEIFNTAFFSKPNELVPSGLRILWSWNAGDGWEIPSSPRFEFASREVLYKLYVVEHVAGNLIQEDNERSLVTLKEFLQLFLPVVDSELYRAQEDHAVASLSNSALNTSDEGR